MGSSVIDRMKLIEELYPICRSITGNGVRETLSILEKHFPLEIYEVASGKKVFDWEVPEEWNISDGYIECPDGNKIANFHDNNLHVMSYSQRVNATMSLEELKDHIHTLPDHPNWIPYRTMYYDRSWAFCLSQNVLDSLPKGMYRAFIDASHTKGSLSYAEAVFPGTSGKEVLFSTYVCHPSMCNDNLSSVSIVASLAKYISKKSSLEHTYRFIFVPETIGAITWLSQNQKLFRKIIAGVNFSCTGNEGTLTFKKSRRENSLADIMMSNTLKEIGYDHDIVDFSPLGSDERQYCSQGINLPMVTLMRSPPGKFDEYHTSADNMDIISEKSLDEVYQACVSFIENLEKNKTYINMYGKCEPQLGKRGLYRKVGGQRTNETSQKAIKWVLSYSDGKHDLLEISNKSGICINDLHDAAKALEDKSIIVRITNKL